MCDTTRGCQKPDKLQGKPGECSPEQIRECHGTDWEHPCVQDESEDSPSTGKCDTRE